MDIRIEMRQGGTRGKFDTSKQFNAPFAAWEMNKSFVLKHNTSYSTPIQMMGGGKERNVDEWYGCIRWWGQPAHKKCVTFSDALTHTDTDMHKLTQLIVAVELPPVFCSLLTEFHVFFMACVPVEGLCVHRRTLQLQGHALHRWRCQGGGLVARQDQNQIKPEKAPNV